MSQTILDEIASVEVTELGTAGNLRVFGLRRPQASTLNYLTLDEALQTNAIAVTEVSEQGHVPTLVATTSCDVMVFLMAGEELVGAKQNRVINKSLMLPARDRVMIPVSCVEQGRWSRQSRAFRSSGSLSHGRLREMMQKDVQESYRLDDCPASDQTRVWDEVHRKMDAMCCESPSTALHQVYEDYRASLDGMLKGISTPTDCCGVAFVIGDRLAGIDVFGRPDTLVKLWPKLLRAYAIDAVEERAMAKPFLEESRIKESLQSLRGANVERYDSPGIGHDLRFQTESLVGAAIIVEEELIHAEVFPERSIVC